MDQRRSKIKWSTVVCLWSAIVSKFWRVQQLIGCHSADWLLSGVSSWLLKGHKESFKIQIGPLPYVSLGYYYAFTAPLLLLRIHCLSLPICYCYAFGTLGKNSCFAILQRLADLLLAEKNLEERSRLVLTRYRKTIGLVGVQRQPKVCGKTLPLSHSSLLTSPFI